MNRKNLANAHILSASGGSIELYPGEADNMPEVPFFATGSQLGVVATIDNSEIVEVTAITGDVLTVTRERRGTALQPLGDGWILGNGIYTQDLDAIMSYVDAAVATAKQEAKEEAHPVGTLYYNADDNTNPEFLLGFGTWVAYAAGRVPVGKAETGTFSVIGATLGREATRHAMPYWGINNNNFQQSGSAYLSSVTDDMNAWLTPEGSSSVSRSVAVRALGSNTGGNSGTGTEVSHLRYTAPNIQPSVVVYIWRRTA